MSTSLTFFSQDKLLKMEFLGQRHNIFRSKDRTVLSSPGKQNRGILIHYISTEMASDGCVGKTQPCFVSRGTIIITVLYNFLNEGKTSYDSIAEAVFEKSSREKSSMYNRSFFFF